MRVFAYLLLLFLVSCAVLLQTTSASLPELAFSSNCTDDEDLESGPPVAQLAVRSRDPAQPFSEWSLLHYYSHDYNGLCNCTGDSFVVDNNTQYQFRIQLSRAPSYCCINAGDFTNQLIELLSPASSTLDWYHEESNQIITDSNANLCPSDNNTSTFLSPILQKSNDPLQCNCDTFCPHNTTDLAVAYEETFANNCTTEHCFPFAPLNKTQMQASINFSLILSFDNPHNCSSLNDINEGILLKATDHLNFTNNLNFYYSTTENNFNNFSNIVPRVVDNGNIVTLNYSSSNNFTVSATFNNNTGLLNFSKNGSEILNRISSVTWEQYTVNNVNLTQGQDCDVWSLDNVAVSVQYEGCVREIFKEDFEGDFNEMNWELMFTNVSSKSSNCTTGSCLYFTGRESNTTVTVRSATTRPLDLRIVRAVEPPHAPSSNTSCSTNETHMLIVFDIATSDFQYPTPCTDNAPNGILLSMNEISHLAYFAPLANTQWENFNAENISLNISDTIIPVWSPQLTETLSVCIANSTIANRGMLDIVWRQDNYAPEHDNWFLDIRSVSIGNITENITTTTNDTSTRYNITLENCVARENYTKCSNGTADSTPRSVILSLNLSEILPPIPTLPTSSTPMPSPQTSSTPTPSPQTSSTPMPSPVPSLEELENLTRQYPLVGLMTFLEQPQDKFSTVQRQELLQIAFNEQPNENVTGIFVETFLKVFQMGSLASQTHESNIAAAVDLLKLLDELALSFANNSAINSRSNYNTIKLSNLTLVVMKVPSDAGRVVGIAVDGSNITLPGVLFSGSADPVLVASYHFRDLSWLVPQPPSNRTYLQPVISSVISCNGCSTSNLSENVSIFFNSISADTTGNFQCVFADLQGGLEDNNSFWTSTNTGCETVTMNGSVLCSCNHLTHFAILLSPGVEIPEVHEKILTIIGYVCVPISLVFLLATIVTFVLLKSLWNMRNYIHCMLCANLIAAQLVFVVGVERTENEAVCSAIAVLLHYLFLVVFMWMLMEGVVLYVALVKVFIKHNKRYIVGFTITSYGLPLVYMAVVAPIGFLVGTGDATNHYGYYSNGNLTACWLRYDTDFIYAFIAPVVVITLTNIGFLVMTIVIMCRHFRKQEKKSNVASTRHWVKVIILLTVVMGITWIGNILFFKEELLFVAYIIAIFIACQGIIIFILFVPLSKQVREAYSKWWKLKQSQSEFLSRLFLTKRSTLAVSGSIPHKLKEEKAQVYIMKTADVTSSAEVFANPSSPSTFTNNSQDSQADEKPTSINQLHLSDSPNQLTSPSPDHNRLSPGMRENGLTDSSQHLLTTDSTAL